MLTTLTIYGASVGPRGATAIAQALYSNTTLEKLDYTENEGGVAGMAALREAWEATRWVSKGKVGSLARKDEHRPVVPQRKEFSKKFIEAIPEHMPQAQWARQELAANPKLVFKAAPR